MFLWPGKHGKVTILICIEGHAASAHQIMKYGYDHYEYLIRFMGT